MVLNKAVFLLLSALSISVVNFSSNIGASSDYQLQVLNLSKQNFNHQNLPEQAIFFCGLSETEVPTTLAIGNDGTEYPIIQWISTFESAEGRTPEERCQAVSQNFQSAYDNGHLKYLRGGRASNGLSIICAATEQGGACLETLFSLAPGTNANQTVRQLWELSEGVRGPLYQTGALYYLNIENLVPLFQIEDSQLTPEIDQETEIYDRDIVEAS